MQASPIACVAVIGKAVSDFVNLRARVCAVKLELSKNNPLYLRTFASTENDPLKFHYVVHTSLDVVEEKLALKKGGTTTPLTPAMLDMYLGLLFPTEDYRVYGYSTNTKIKFVLVLDDSLTDVKEAEIRQFFKNFHALFVDMVSNPFYIPDEKIDSKRFDKRVTNLVNSFSAVAK